MEGRKKKLSPLWDVNVIYNILFSYQSFSSRFFSTLERGEGALMVICDDVGGGGGRRSEQIGMDFTLKLQTHAGVSRTWFCCLMFTTRNIWRKKLLLLLFLFSSAMIFPQKENYERNRQERSGENCDAGVSVRDVQFTYLWALPGDAFAFRWAFVAPYNCQFLSN